MRKVVIEDAFAECEGREPGSIADAPGGVQTAADADRPEHHRQRSARSNGRAQSPPLVHAGPLRTELVGDGSEPDLALLEVLDISECRPQQRVELAATQQSQARAGIVVGFS